MVASSVALSTHRDRAVRIPLDPHRPGPAADLAILHQHGFARLEIRRLDFDAARLAAERTFDLEDHHLSLTDRPPLASPALKDRLFLAGLRAVSRTGTMPVLTARVLADCAATSNDYGMGLVLLRHSRWDRALASASRTRAGLLTSSLRGGQSALLPQFQTRKATTAAFKISRTRRVAVTLPHRQSGNKDVVRGI